MASLMQSIKRRLSGSTPPPLKFEGASDSYPTMIISEDVYREPPRRLIELAFAAVRATMDEVNLDHLKTRASVEDWSWIWPGEHYRLLAGLVKVMQPKAVIEVGTDSGLSSLCMKHYLPTDGKIVTYDLIPWTEVDGRDLTEVDFADGRLEQRLADLGDSATFEKNRSLVESAEFMFIDGPKNVTFENALMKNLATVKFAKPPIVMFDDTRLPSMLKFWRDLKYPKLDLTGFAHWSGTGLVELV